MGIAKEMMMEHDEGDSANWRTWTCKHCKNTYKVNTKTKTNVNENGWRPECYEMLNNMEK